MFDFNLDKQLLIHSEEFKRNIQEHDYWGYGINCSFDFNGFILHFYTLLCFYKCKVQ